MSMVFTLLAVSASAAGPDVHPVRGSGADTRGN
jgi:hypothetical protein